MCDTLPAVITYERKGEKPIVEHVRGDIWRPKVPHVLEAIRDGHVFFGKSLSYDGTEIFCRTSWEFDGASIPKLVRWIIRKTDKTRDGALPHDASYELSHYGVWDNIPNARLRIDRQFYHDLRKCGVSWLKARIMYSAVRAGGWTHWGKRGAERAGLRQ